jgi:hypothetical protein
MQSRSLPFGIALFTVATFGEFAALYYWQRLVGFHVFEGVTVLWAGFLVERGTVVAWLRLPRELPDPWGKVRPLWLILLLVTSAEILAWSLWWPLSTNLGFLMGAFFLFFTIHAIHGYEVAIISRTGFMPAITNFGTVALSIIEATGGTVWLRLIEKRRPDLGALVLLASLLVEHILQVLGQRRKT